MPCKHLPVPNDRIFHCTVNGELPAFLRHIRLNAKIQDRPFLNQPLPWRQSVSPHRIRCARKVAPLFCRFFFRQDQLFFDLAQYAFRLFASALVVVHRTLPISQPFSRINRALSRCQLRSFSVWRLSACLLPCASPSSTFTRPISSKYSLSGMRVIPLR